MLTMTIKVWVIDKAQDVARKYDTYLNITSRDDNGVICEDKNGCYTVEVVEVVSETEKAMQIKVATGAVVGSYKGWTMWVPKSQIV